MESKKCCQCKKIKPLDQFYKHETNKDGRRNKCKCCEIKACKKRKAKKKADPLDKFYNFF